MLSTFRYVRPTTQKKALLVAIQYKQSSYPGMEPLLDTVTGLMKFKEHLIRYWGYLEENIVVLIEDSEDESLKPTRDNILRELKRLVSDAKRGDTRVFWYAGHSYQVKDISGDEPDGLDEALVPLDHHGPPVDENGDPLDPRSPEARDKLAYIILDDDLREILVNQLPHGVRLRAVFDTCTSGSLLDMKHNWPHCQYVENIKSSPETHVHGLSESPKTQPGPKRRRTVFCPDPVDDQSGRRLTVYENRRGSLPMPQRQQSFPSRWLGLQEHRCLKLSRPFQKRKNSAKRPDRESALKDVISIGSTVDGGQTFSVPGLSMTLGLIHTIEQSRSPIMSWRQFLQDLNGWIWGGTLACFVKMNKQLGQASSLSAEEFYDMHNFCNPQLGSDSHLMFDDIIGF